MAKDSSSRRAWVKNVAIIFLVILLLLTFFSNTILNYSLPEVSAQYAAYGTLSTSIKLSGTVKANESYNVVYEADIAEQNAGMTQSRKVVSVFVKEGDYVEKDAVILTLKGGPSDQLASSEKELESLRNQLNIALLNKSVSDLTGTSGLTTSRRELTNLQADLAKLKEKYNTAVTGNADSLIATIESELKELKKAQADVNALKTKAEADMKELETLVESANDAFTTLSISERLVEAEAKYYDAEVLYNDLKAQSDSLNEQLEYIKETNSDIGKANTLTNQIKTLESQLAELVKSYERKLEDYEEEKAEYEEKTADDKFAIKQLEDQVKYVSGDTNTEKVSTLQQRINEIKSYTEYINTQKQISDIQKEITKLMGDSDFESLDSETKKQIYELNDTIEDLQADISDELEEIADCNYKISCIEQINSLESEIADLEDDFKATEKTFSRYQEDTFEDMHDLEDQLRDAEEKLSVIGYPEVDDVIDYAADYDLESVQNELAKVTAKLTDAESAYNEAKTSVETLRKQSQAEIMLPDYTAFVEKYTDQYDDYQERIDELTEELTDLEVKEKPEEIEAQIKLKEADIYAKQIAIQQAELSSQITDTEKTKEIADLEKQISDLETKIEAYKTAPETTSVTAPIAGRIVSINFVPGDSISSGASVAAIEIADKGYVVEISLPAEEARKIQVGAPVTIENSWWYSNIEASITQIRSDAQSQGKNRIIIIDVKGDVYEGQSLKFSVGDKSQSYDTVLPNSAIREDNDGKFVLVVDAKPTPLGTRYTSRRVEIEVIASDDTKSAVSGLYGSEFVVTNATSPISDNQQVRLAEN